MPRHGVAVPGRRAHPIRTQIGRATANVGSREFSAASIKLGRQSFGNEAVCRPRDRLGKVALEVVGEPER